MNGSRTEAVGLLDLEHHRVLPIATLEQHDEAAGPDTPDPDHLQGEVDEPIALDELAPVLGQRVAVGREHDLKCVVGDLDVADHRRVVDDPPGIALDSRHRVGRAQSVLLAGLGEEGIQSLPATRLVDLAPVEPLEGRLDVLRRDLLVPDVQESHPGVAGHRLPVRGDCAERRGPGVGRAEAVLARRDHDACGQPFDIPLPRRRQGLIEVVGVEHEGALG